jgi:hypothetical protein
MKAHAPDVLAIGHGVERLLNGVGMVPQYQHRFINASGL